MEPTPTTKLYLGDCLEILPTLPDCSVDCIVTDPPFGHNNNDGDLISNIEKAVPSRRAKYDHHHSLKYEARPIANDGPEANIIFQKVVQEFKRLLRKGGCCACCCCGGGGPDPQFARWSLWLDKVLDFKQMVVWDKGPMGLGWHYRRSYETVLVATKPGGKCRWFDKTCRVENVIRPGHRGIRKIIPSEDQHPCEKPVALASLFLQLHAQRGDMILDPFMGRGWVGVAAKRLGMSFTGIEIDPRWHEAAKKRIEGSFVPQGIWAC
jgi:site-specific DNA-methyltransferase (adenine-specific)